MAIMTAEDLNAPYAYVSSEKIVSDAVRLLIVGRESGLPTAVTETTTGTRLAFGGLMRLEGLGKELWSGVDPQRYIRDLRDEWGNR